ncbi:TIGR03086 family metal-binding protein [Salinactinospora qingdaonensis]|uniref:TIGR03086 family metal-binding protein n=1 Tax=Salinactinospora qingdaonensis TaxID=702744 RepID=A0ABP7FGP5_9ACTN
MSQPLDLEPAVRRMQAVVSGIADSQLADPTPCEGTSVGDLLDHVVALTLAFRHAAEKSASPETGPPPEPTAANLPADWRELLAYRLDALVAAWREPAAWEGTTVAGGVELPAHEAGVVAVNELVVHGWDLARATGQSYECDPASAEASFAFASQVPDDPKARKGLFGPVVDVADDAPLFDRALGFSGRDPSWRP